MGEFCYMLGSGLKTFFDADEACKDVGSILVEPRSDKINNVTKQFVTQARNNVYIGLRRSSSRDTPRGTAILSYSWESDKSPESYADWAPGRPGGGECVVMRGDNLLWNDFDCTLVTSYLCQARKRKSRFITSLIVLAGVLPFRKTGFKTHQISIEVYSFNQF